MNLAKPNEAFLKPGRGKRFHLYLWKWKKVRFIRLPSGVGVYSYVPTDTPIAVQTGYGQAWRLNMPPTASLTPYFVALFRGFTPLPFGELKALIRTLERRTEDIRALSVKDLRKRFSGLRVAPEDSYAAGHCWYGSKAWAESWLDDPAPTVEAVLSGLDRLPANEQAAFISAAAYAVAYVVGDEDALISGADEADYLRAVQEGRKADGSGAFRLSRLNGSINARNRSGAKITAS